ncbi:hypothetical protein BDQ17DRAFT_1330939 [Cyathus striatus]|nr:hypothetical protein BDQ17DRAFT_1330939 [Cyathus striatus]
MSDSYFYFGMVNVRKLLNNLRRRSKLEVGWKKAPAASAALRAQPSWEYNTTSNPRNFDFDYQHQRGSRVQTDAAHLKFEVILWDYPTENHDRQFSKSLYTVIHALLYHFPGGDTNASAHRSPKYTIPPLTGVIDLILVLVVAHTKTSSYTLWDFGISSRTFLVALW